MAVHRRCNDTHFTSTAHSRIIAPFAVGIALFVCLVLFLGFLPKFCYGIIGRSLCVILRLHFNIFGLGRVKSILLHAVLELVAQAIFTSGILGAVSRELACGQTAIGHEPLGYWLAVNILHSIRLWRTAVINLTRWNIKTQSCGRFSPCELCLELFGGSLLPALGCERLGHALNLRDACL